MLGVISRASRPLRFLIFIGGLVSIPVASVADPIVHHARTAPPGLLAAHDDDTLDLPRALSCPGADSDGDGVGDGWYVDDVRVSSVLATGSPTVGLDTVDNSALPACPP